jgi:Spy/CpxP family protein refolding chaperone
MKYKPRRTGLLAALLATVILTSITTFAAGERLRGRHGANLHARVAEELGLTPEQRQRIDAIRVEHADSLKAARQNAADKRRALEDAYAAEPVDKAAVDARMREMTEAHAVLIQAVSALRLDVMEVLTPEQRAKARDIKTKARERFEGRRKALRDRSAT